jgi:Na+-transporting NADH:ubiquinone oxidoreductase subunit A
MAGGEPQTRSQLNGYITHLLNGPYPAGDPGVLLYHIKKHTEENRSWTISGQNLLLLAQTIQSGHYAVDRIVVVAGSQARYQQHVSTRIGAPLEYIAGELTSVTHSTRYVTGGLFNGYESQKESYMGLFETALIVLPQGDQKELFGFARPGFSKPSHSRAFLSTFNKAPLKMDCGMHGEVRACINCGYCTQVCAVDILPQFTLKSVLAGELEEALAHGLLDCVACGLCTYVCPSKIEISTRLSEAKQEYYKEIS